MLRGSAHIAADAASPSLALPPAERGSYQAGSFYGTPRSTYTGGDQLQIASASTSPRRADDPRIILPVQEYHSAYAADADALLPPHRQPSFPRLLPISAVRNRASVPARPIWPGSEDMPLTGDSKRRGARHSDIPRAGGGRLAGWLSGSSSEESAPRGQQLSPLATRISSSPDSTPPRKSMAAASETSTPSRLASFASSISATLSQLTQTPASSTADDELLSLDVEKALFPAGSPVERDPFSPAAFKNLQANATGLLLKMQGAYRRRVGAVADLEAEAGARQEELQEAETRMQHFKMQLERMARRAAQQQRDMELLADELAAERRARAHERMMREKGMAAISGVRDHPSEGSTVSEDLGVEDDQRAGHKWRKSLKSDGSYDTDDESVEDESVFSRSRSPTIAPSTFDGASVVDAPVSHPRVAALGQPGRQKPAAGAMTTFQKLVKNVVSSALKEEEDEYGGGGTSCRNCRGQDASFAWNTVSLLRDENKHLKQRVGQLDAAIDGALDLANGIGLDLK